jgi:hypothetical protein
MHGCSEQWPGEDNNNMDREHGHRGAARGILAQPHHFPEVASVAANELTECVKEWQESWFKIDSRTYAPSRAPSTYLSACLLGLTVLANAPTPQLTPIAPPSSHHHRSGAGPAWTTSRRCGARQHRVSEQNVTSPCSCRQHPTPARTCATNTGSIHQSLQGAGNASLPLASTST